MLKKFPIRQLYMSLLCLAVLLSFLPCSARAYGHINTGRPVSLTLRYQKDQPISGVRFSLYRVADVSDTAEFELAGDFKDYPVSLDQPDADSWKSLAETLVGYVARDSLKPLDSGATDQAGVLRFPTGQQETLMPGLYLVTGERHVYDGHTYTPSPFLICLPNLDTETDQWVYDETAYPKYTRKFDGGGGGGGDTTITRKVLKVWEHGDNQEQRPEEITVQLLRDGKVYKTAVLNAKNNWRYTWSDLDPDYEWQVVEKDVPDGYTVSVTREGITFVVTNTYQSDEPDEPDNPDNPNNPDEPDNPDNPDSPDTPDTPVNPGNPGTPGNPDQPSRPGRPGQPSLPQTGQLWWPVPVLAGSGMLLFTLGWVRAQKRGREDEQ